MKLYIANQPLTPLCGVVIEPQDMALKITHLTLASQQWDDLYIDLDEAIPEGSLRFLPTKCKHIHVNYPSKPSLHQLHLLIELYPQMDGQLRKAYMKGDAISGILPEVWEHGSKA